MNWPGVTAPAAAWLFALLIPLVIFYFLKLKRPRMDIPSLALWRQVMNDQRVNSPFQRFKRNILLLLQILLLLCVAVAAMQPFLPSGADRARYIPVLIDCSASMGALEKQGGQTRLDEAKARVGEMIDNLLPDQRMSLIAVDSSTRRLTEFTNNKRVLREALAELKVHEVGSRLEDALRLTQAMARSVPIESAIFYTDGNVPEQIDFELPFELNYQRLPVGGPNMGITALNARRARGSRWEVFARLTCSKAAGGTANVLLFQDAKQVGEQSVVLDPGETQRLVFTVESETAAAIELRLQPQNFDSLAADNIASLDLPVSRPLTVYCPLDLETYRLALKAQTDLVLYPADEDAESGGSQPSSFDLALSQEAASPIEAFVKMTVGAIPPELARLVSVKTGLVEIVDWQRTAPILQHVQLADVQITDQPVTAEGVREKDFEELGYEILAQARTGPLILQKTDGDRVGFYFLFHTDRSTLPYRVGFPILVSNLVDVALQHAALSETRALPTGTAPTRVLQPNHNYRVTGPNGFTRDIESNDTGELGAFSTPVAGRYGIWDGQQKVDEIPVSLVQPDETLLTSVESIQFKEMKVEAAATLLKNDRPLWTWFAGIGFCALLVEWWYFQRRPGGVLR